MGYKLDVTTEDGRLSYYGTKLYGYVHDEKELASYRYLEKIGKLDPEQYYFWGEGSDHEMRLTKEEFAEFAKLYEQDVRSFLTPYRRKIGYHENWSWAECDSVCFNGVTSMAELVESDGDKIISWG